VITVLKVGSVLRGNHPMELKDLMQPLVKALVVAVLTPLDRNDRSILATSQIQPSYEAKTTVLIGRPIEALNRPTPELALGLATGEHLLQKCSAENGSARPPMQAWDSVNCPPIRSALSRTPS